MTLVDRSPNPLLGHPKYEKVKDLSHGTFGFVQLAVNKHTGEKVAIKFIERGPEQVSKYVEREILNHRELQHYHVIQFKEVFLIPDYLCIAMEYAAGGDMFGYVVKRKRLSEDVSRWLFQQLVIALDYCHRGGIVSRDIKLENTLLDSNEDAHPILKLCDFGYSKHERYQSAPGSRVGTPAYMAPEVITARQGRTYDGKTADVWSSGVMLYVMLVGSYPFERPEDRNEHQMGRRTKVMERILNQDFVIPPEVHLTPECHDLLRRMLTKDFKRRITIADIYHHPWFLRYLPAAALTMNDNPAPVPEEIQRPEEIARIVQEARKPGPSAMASYNEEEYIEDYITDELVDSDNLDRQYE